MVESKASVDPRRPHDRLWTRYAQAHAAFAAMECEIDDLVEAGAMDRAEAEGCSAAEWGDRLDYLKVWTEKLALRIESSVDGAGEPVDAHDAAEGMNNLVERWRAGLIREGEPSNRETGSGPSGQNGAL